MAAYLTAMRMDAMGRGVDDVLEDPTPACVHPSP